MTARTNRSQKWKNGRALRARKPTARANRLVGKEHEESCEHSTASPPPEEGGSHRVAPPFPQSLSNQPRKSRVRGERPERVEDGGGWTSGAGGAEAGVLEAAAPECAGLTGAEARSAAAGGRAWAWWARARATWTSPEPCPDPVSGELEGLSRRRIAGWRVWEPVS